MFNSKGIQTKVMAKLAGSMAVLLRFNNNNHDNNNELAEKKDRGMKDVKE